MEYRDMPIDTIRKDSLPHIDTTPISDMNKQEEQVIRDVWECKLCDCLTQHFKKCLGLKDVMPEVYFNLYKSAQKKHRRQW